MEKDLYKALSNNVAFAVKYFTMKYHRLPTVKVYRNRFDAEELNKQTRLLYPDKDIYIRFNKEYQARLKGAQWEMFDASFFCEVKEGLLFSYENGDLFVCHDLNIDNDELKQLETLFSKCKRKSESTRNKFSMIKRREFGDFDLTEFKIKKLKVSIEENYNDDLIKLNAKIVKFLSSENENGIVLFHGIPGSGKTSYIRNLISECNTRFIYIPNNLFNHISDPDFISFISTYPDSVIILEDCEDLLKNREKNETGSGISALLNLGDGLLGDALQLKIICTFNCDLSKIDEALLRKGRLIYRYEFGKLDKTKVTELAKKLNINKEITEAMTLADIYNLSHDNNNGISKKTEIGFAKLAD